jgi:hypothetical protein
VTGVASPAAAPAAAGSNAAGSFGPTGAPKDSVVHFLGGVMNALLD